MNFNLVRARTRNNGSLFRQIIITKMINSDVFSFKFGEKRKRKGTRALFCQWRVLPFDKNTIRWKKW
jgi:hypothetical protein